ncbi:MAG: GAF domain-containing protein, partial [Anaerolineae bacterium]
MKHFLFSLRFRLIVLVLLAIIPATGLLLYTATHARQAAVAAARREMLSLTSAVSAQQDLLTESTHQLLAGLARLHEIREGNAEGCSAHLSALIHENPIYANIIVVDPQGDLWCSAVPSTGPVNFADRAWFQEAMRTRQFATGGYVMGRLTGKPLANFTYPLLDERGQVQTIIAAGLDLAWLDRYLAQVPLPEGAMFMVLDAQGTILARTLEGEQWVGKTAPEAEIVRIVLAQRAAGTVEAAGVDGVRRLYAFTPLTGGGYVLAGIPVAQLYGEANRVLHTSLLGLGLVTLLALAAAWIGGDAFLLRRVNALLVAAQRMAAGDLSTRTGISYGMGELSQLARAFDEMAASLERQVGEQRRIETALRVSEARLHHLFSVSPAIIYSLRPDDFVTTWVSPNVTTMLGYAPEEALQPGWWTDHLHPEDREGVLSVAARILETGQAIHEYRFYRKDGELIWIHDELRLLRDERGNPVEIVGAWTNITERKRDEEQIIRQLQTLTALFAGAQRLAESLNMEEMAREITRICVEIFGVRLAWLGRAEEDGRVTPIAVFPADHPYPRAITVRWDETPEGQGPTGCAIRTGFLQVVDDTTTDPRFVPWRSHAGTYDLRSSAAFPLTSRGHTFGALNLYSDQPGFFTPDLVDIFQALAHQAAAALENARLYDDALRRLKHLQALRAIDMAIAGDPQSRFTIGALLDLALTKVTRQLGVDAAAVLLWDQEAGVLTYAAGRGFRGRVIERTRLRLGEGYAGRAAQEQRAFGVGDVDRSGGCVHISLLQEEGFVAYYAAPLIAKGRLLGVLEIFHRARRDYNGEWLEFLEALAGQIAIAIENARLYQELEAYAAELEQRVAERTAELAAANEELRRAHAEVSRALAQERELNELKTRFVSMVSHEFRTPQTTILSSAELLEHYGPRWPEEKKLTHLRRIAETVQRMTALLDDVLTLSRADAGRLGCNPQALDLVPWCRELVEEFQLGMGAGHRLVLEWAGPGEPERWPVVMDGQLLHHILSNLLSNAIKYSPIDGPIALDLREEDSAVVLQVRDQGI